MSSSVRIRPSLFFLPPLAARSFSHFWAGLIAADMEVPGDLGDGFEPAAGVDIDAAVGGIEGRGLGDAGFAAAGETDALVVGEDRQLVRAEAMLGIEQMGSDEIGADWHQCLE